MKTLRLYGALARLTGRRVFSIDVGSAAEAIRFLLANYPWVEKHMTGSHYQIYVSGKEIEPEAQIHHPVGCGEEIALVPVFCGSGAGGRIALGAGLIALSFGNPVLFGIGLKAVAFNVGVSLVLGGVAQLLTPVPRANTALSSDPAAGEFYAFNQVVNVTRQGVPVPLIYGEPICGSVVISAALDL